MKIRQLPQIGAGAVDGEYLWTVDGEYLWTD
jgi:hypothetical protein